MYSHKHHLRYSLSHIQHLRCTKPILTCTVFPRSNPPPNNQHNHQCNVRIRHHLKQQTPSLHNNQLLLGSLFSRHPKPPLLDLCPHKPRLLIAAAPGQGEWDGRHPCCFLAPSTMLSRPATVVGFLDALHFCLTCPLRGQVASGEVLHEKCWILFAIQNRLNYSTSSLVAISQPMIIKVHSIWWWWYYWCFWGLDHCWVRWWHAQNSLCTIVSGQFHAPTTWIVTIALKTGATAFTPAGCCLVDPLR